MIVLIVIIPFYDLRLNYSNLVLTPFYQSISIWLADTSISPGLAILPLRECLRMVRHLYTRPLNFISRLLDFTPPVKVFPNSSRARECNCLYSATHTSEQGKKFPPFLKFISWLYLVGCTYAHLTCCTCILPAHMDIFNLPTSRFKKLNYIISTPNRLGGVPIHIIRETKIVI